jgi:hypothetical protein
MMEFSFVVHSRKLDTLVSVAIVVVLFVSKRKDEIFSPRDRPYCRSSQSHRSVGGVDVPNENLSK